MAGGMGARERGLTLAERSGVAASDRSPPGACHCWVIDGGERRPGLLLEWRRQAGRWEGLVAYLITDGAGRALTRAAMARQRAAALGRPPCELYIYYWHDSSDGTRRPFLTHNVKVLSGVSFLQDAASELLYPILPIFLTVTLGRAGSRCRDHRGRSPRVRPA